MEMGGAGDAFGHASSCPETNPIARMVDYGDSVGPCRGQSTPCFFSSVGDLAVALDVARCRKASRSLDTIAPGPCSPPRSKPFRVPCLPVGLLPQRADKYPSGYR